MKDKQVGRRVARGGWVRKELEGGPLSRELLTIKLMRLGDFVGRRGRVIFAQHSDFTELELNVLIWACEKPPVSINDLSALVHRGAGQVSRTVQKLVDAGLLNRVNRGGGPTVSITPTALGRTVYAPLVELARQFDAEITRGLPKKDRPALERCIDLLIRDTVELLAHPPRETGSRRAKSRAKP